MFKLFIAALLFFAFPSIHSSIQQRIDQDIDKIKEIRGLVESDHFDAVLSCGNTCKMCNKKCNNCSYCTKC